MPSASDAQRWYEFDDLRLERHSQRVFRGDAQIHLPPLSRKMLLALVEAEPSVLTHDDLVREVWQGRYASAETILQRIKLLRSALGDDVHSPRYVALVRGVGYHLIPPVRIVSRPHVQAQSILTQQKTGKRLAAGACLLLVVGAVWWASPRVLVPDSGRAVAGAPESRGVPESARSLYEQGILYHRRGPGDLELAERRYQQAIAQAPGFADPWVGLASIANFHYLSGLPQTHQEFVEQQRSLLEHALELQPSLALAHARMAQLLWSTTTARETVDYHFQQALQYGADDPMVLAIYATELHRSGQDREALRISERVVRLDPYSAVHRLNLAAIYMYSGEFGPAERELKSLRELHPNLGLSLEYARLRLLQGYPERALSYLPLIEHDADRLAIQAMALFEQGETARSRTLLHELEAMDNPYAYTRHAEARYFMGGNDPLTVQIAMLGEQWSARPTQRAELVQAAIELLFSPFTRATERNASADDLLALYVAEPPGLALPALWPCACA